MSRVYLVSDNDLERLRAFLDRDPSHGYSGGSSATFSDEEIKTHAEAHNFFNYQIMRWIGEVKE